MRPTCRSAAKRIRSRSVSNSTYPPRPTWPVCSRCACVSQSGAPSRSPRSHGRTTRLGQRDLPQGPAAVRLGHCRLRWRHRQPALRHVRHGRHAGRHGACRPADRAVLLRPARRPRPPQREVGRRVADHLRDVPRHGPRLLGRPGADLPAGRRAVRLLRGAARHHGADTADDHRRDAGPRAARRAVHRDLDDRDDRPRRHHRPQLDPARRLHQPRGGSRPAAGGCRDPRRVRARTARSP